MEIGTTGAGAFAQAFVKRALKTGHKVKLSNDQGPDSLREIVIQLGPGAVAVPKEMAASCELVRLALPWDNVPGTLPSLPMWTKHILFDGTNPPANAPSETVRGKASPPSSSLLFNSASAVFPSS